MAMMAVNLLGRKQRFWGKRRRMVRLVQLSSGAVLLVYLVFSFIIFAYSYYLRVQAEERTARIKKYEVTINQFASVEQEYVLLKEKLSLLAKLFKGRQSQHQILRQIYDLAPEGVTVRSVDFGRTEKSTEVNVAGSADSVYELVALFNVLADKGVDLGFKQIRFDRLTRNVDSSYVFSLIISTKLLEAG